MTATEIDTTPLTAEEAQGLTDRLRKALNFSAETVTTMYFRRGWAALGYDNWDDYCETEFGASRIRLPRETRQEMVTSLHQQGMSIRAISAATGHSKNTVMKDVSQSGTPAKPPVTDLITGDDLDALNVPPATTTGKDGKSYPRPEPKPEPILDAEVVEDPPVPPRAAPRKALTDVARDLALDLKALATRIEKFNADDRLTRNADEVGAVLRHHLARTITACQGLDRSINHQESTS